MTEDFQIKVVGEFTARISIKLDEAARISRAAKSLGSQDLWERAFRTLLDIEPLIADATTLLNAASIIRRGTDVDS